ncbi:MAG TPA: Gfo/Idh/MocA family oxidoreductase [Verrucomicrobiae bacterium]
MQPLSRRSFLGRSAGGLLGLSLVPALIPARLRGADSPANKINVAQIGCGRMGRSDMGNVLTEPLARVVAVCDLDAYRLGQGKKMAENYYTTRGESHVNVRTYHDFREVLAAPDIDAVVITVPDHSHAYVAVAAALAGKHIYVQKPVTYSIGEAICLRKVVEAKRTILQTGSQQRSERPWGSFRAASEAVRNGRIGRLKRIQIGIGIDQPSGKHPAASAIPATLDYERWLGPAPEQAYMEGRVHPQHNLEGRPGWITTEDFGLGMITNWGAHHVDIAQWAMGQELGGPLAVDATAKFIQNDLRTVHGSYHVVMQYPGQVEVVLDDKFENGIRFEGEEGWVFCSRSEESVTASDPVSAKNREALRPLRASDPKILGPLGADAIRWQPSHSHYGNWLESILARRQPIAPIQHSVRSLEACAAAWISMKLNRPVKWDAATETFGNDVAANALRKRPARKAEYDCELALKNAGIA